MEHVGIEQGKFYFLFSWVALINEQISDGRRRSFIMLIVGEYMTLSLSGIINWAFELVCSF